MTVLSSSFAFDGGTGSVKSRYRRLQTNDGSESFKFVVSQEELTRHLETFLAKPSRFAFFMGCFSRPTRFR